MNNVSKLLNSACERHVMRRSATKVDQKAKSRLAAVAIALALASVIKAGTPSRASQLPPNRPITCVDTMKESRDSDTNPLTDAQIADDVSVTSQLHPAYITVDTFYDYPAYMQRWIHAIRAAHHNVWFRCCFNAWEGNNGVAATMTPAQYTKALIGFIDAHPAFFKDGDILDPLPESENGKYWTKFSPEGKEWTWRNAPNTTTDEYNRFFVGLSHAADAALERHGIHGVITCIRSTNGWIAARPQTLYPATIAAMGCVTTDTYVGQAAAIAPPDALKALQAEIEGIERVRHVPLVIGELGYSIDALVDDQQQCAVLKPQLDWLGTLPYLRGFSYWVGAGYPAPDKYNGTRLFTGTTGAWTLRPSAKIVADCFAKLNTSQRH